MEAVSTPADAARAARAAEFARRNTPEALASFAQRFFTGIDLGRPELAAAKQRLAEGRPVEALEAFKRVLLTNGAILVTAAMGATNRQVYVHNGATLRLRGQQTLGVSGTSFALYCNEAGGRIDVPDADDRVTILGRVGIQAHGLLTKTGKGTLTLSNWTQQQNESFLSIPSWKYTVEEGALGLGDQTYGNRWLSIRYLFGRWMHAP